jgi:hypothetical protein
LVFISRIRKLKKKQLINIAGVGMMIQVAIRRDGIGGS